MSRLKDKRCIVTGGAQGIGKAIAKKFLLEGASVLICDIKQDHLEQAVEDLSAFGQIEAFRTDISDSTDVKHLVEAATQRFKGIDVLVNNAGIAKFEPFTDISEASWDRVLSVNLKGTFLVSRAVSTIMMEQRGGSIVNMASTNGLRGEASLAHYNASKAGIILLTRTMAIELALFQIRVNSVCPGFIATDLAERSGQEATELGQMIANVPLGRRGTPEEVANVFSFLASDEASFVTGTEIVVDGGQICHQ